MDSLEHIINQFPGRRVLVIGDVMLDEYLHGRVDRISPEAPVPVVRLRERSAKPGGAANVALNLLGLGAEVKLVGMCGADEPGDLLKSVCAEAGLATDGLHTSSARRTTRKARVMSQGQQLLRVDTEDNDPATASESQALAKAVDQLLKSEWPEVILFEDYDKGVLTPHLIETTLKTARAQAIPTVVDPKERNFWSYRGASLFKPNLAELQASSSLDTNAASLHGRLLPALTQLRNRLEHDISLVTLGALGAALETADGEFYQAAALARNVVDVCGAGDSVAAAVALGLVSGAKPQNLLALANRSGAIACGYIGVKPITIAELRKQPAESLSV